MVQVAAPQQQIGVASLVHIGWKAKSHAAIQPINAAANQNGRTRAASTTAKSKSSPEAKH